MKISLELKIKLYIKWTYVLDLKILHIALLLLNLPDNFFQPVSIETMQFIQDIMSFAKCFLCTYYEKGKDWTCAYINYN